METEKRSWIKSHMTFDKTTANALNLVKVRLDKGDNDTINYKIMRLCLYVGIMLNSEERRTLIDVKEKVDNASLANKTYNVPIAVLLTNELDLKRMLFSVCINEIGNDLDVQILQEKWNNPSLKVTEDPYARKFYEHIENGALFIYKLFEVDKFSLLKTNQILFEILSRKEKGNAEIGDIEDIDIFKYKG